MEAKVWVLAAKCPNCGRIKDKCYVEAFEERPYPFVETASWVREKSQEEVLCMVQTGCGAVVQPLFATEPVQ